MARKFYDTNSFEGPVQFNGPTSLAASLGLQIASGAPAVTTDKLYQVGSALFWGAAAVMINPMTASGDIIYGGASGAPTRLGKGTDGQVLSLASGVPAWTTPSTGGSSTRVPVANINHTVTGTGNQTIAYTSLTATRTVTLPAATTAEQIVCVQDESGAAAWGVKITIQRAGTDTIHDGTCTSVDIFQANGSVTFKSNGSGKWMIVDRSPTVWSTRWTANTTLRLPPDCREQSFLVVSGGGGGGNAGLQAATYRGGGGGGAGTGLLWRGSLPVNTDHAITIGAGGLGRAAGANSSGGAGGSSSVGTYLTVPGGGGGTYGGLGAGGGSGATTTSGAIEVVQFLLAATSACPANTNRGGGGGRGGNAGAASGNGTTPSWSVYSGGSGASNPGGSCPGGGGGSSWWGQGGNGGYSTTGFDTFPPTVGSGYGAGGGGACMLSDGVTKTASTAGTGGFIDAIFYF